MTGQETEDQKYSNDDTKITWSYWTIFEPWKNPAKRRCTWGPRIVCVCRLIYSETCES